MTVISLGIDPGTANPASALLRRNNGGAWEVLRLPVLHSLEELNDELLAILNGPREIRPTVVSFESVAWSLHAKAGESGHGSGRILESVGAVRMFAKVLGLVPMEFTPASWRKDATGSGNSTKEQARSIVQRRVTGWPKGKIGLNRSDAACIALAGGFHAYRQLEIRSLMGGAR